MLYEYAKVYEDFPIRKVFRLAMWVRTQVIRVLFTSGNAAPMLGKKLNWFCTLALRNRPTAAPDLRRNLKMRGRDGLLPLPLRSSSSTSAVRGRVERTYGADWEHARRADPAECTYGAD
jgi:hypothetical protein